MLGNDAMVLMVQGGEVWGAVALSWHRAARGLEGDCAGWQCYSAVKALDYNRKICSAG